VSRERLGVQMIATRTTMLYTNRSVSGGGPATDLFRVLLDHLRVMTGRIPILLCQYVAVITIL
ncbi:MAG TPA: hypothetical protein VEH06_06480, partial [Candidatus Bathyarchaeia archaeon]|nr:hypothetical protein [Candidatus Bathyarchaeia archaeon]